MSQFTLGKIYGLETADTEFKEFCLKRSPDLFLSNEEIEFIINNNKWNLKLTENINNSLEDYFEFVIPKYISTFSNSQIDGKIIIGVNDYGEITGIPYYGPLDYQSIIESFKKKFIINFKSTDDIDYIMKNIKLELILLKKDVTFLEDEVDTYYQLYKNHILSFNNKMHDYLEIRSSWELKLLIYARKLSDLINTSKTRAELIQYIIDRNEENEKININRILNLLKSNCYINIPPGEEIAFLKEDPTSFVYWLVKFKDDKVQEISKQKPKKPINPCFFGLSQILSKISYLRYRFCENPNINYYLLIVHINGSNLDHNSSYKLNNQTGWVYQQRIVDENGSPRSI